MGLKFVGSIINSGKSADTNAPSYDGYAVTASDSVDLPNGATDAIYVTGAGNVNVQLASSDGVTAGGTAVLTSMFAGQILPIAVSRVLSTSTTATGIYALYR